MDLDVGNAGLARHWLAELGWETRDDERPDDPPDVVVLETRHPRLDLLEPTLQLLRRWCGAPVLLISPAILPRTPPMGALAHELGVAAVLSVPLDRAAFVTVCHRLARPGRSDEDRA